MECTDIATLSDLSYCSGEGAIIHIGELEEYPGYTDASEFRILFTNLATGHKTVIPIKGDELPELVIESEDFSPVPGYVYQIQAVRVASGGGITPLRLLPFEVLYTGYNVSATGYDALIARFVKVFTSTPTVDIATEQYLSLPQ